MRTLSLPQSAELAWEAPPKKGEDPGVATEDASEHSQRR